MKKSFVFLSILSVFFFAAEVFAEAPKFGIGARAGYNFTRDGSMDVSAPGFGMVGNVDYSNNGSWMLGLNGTLQINKYISTEIGIDWIDSSRNEFKIAGGSWTAGDIKQMPITFTARFHYPVGIFSPYLGLGLGYYFRSYDEDNTFWAAGTNVDVDNGWGYHVNAGSDIFLTAARNLALNLDAKYVWSKADITATNGAAKLEGSMNLDSIMLGLGIKYYF
ncbi:MAG: OmpW family outer membrane protein [Smithella sp.]